MGYIDFDDKRYWDVREMQNFDPVPIPKTELCTDIEGSLPVVLPSDASLRMDSMALIAGDVEQA
jgi:hypothetical protein